MNRAYFSKVDQYESGLILVSCPDPDSHSCADGLHHRCVERGSGELPYSILSTVTRMLGNQSDSRYGVIAYLSYYRELLVIAMGIDDVRRTIK